MAKARFPRKQVRPVVVPESPQVVFTGVEDIFAGRRRPVTACEVVAEIKRGSLAKLDRYLQQPNCRLDREIALELHKLISGSLRSTRYRLMVVDHPDKPVMKGGRPKALEMAPTAKHLVYVKTFNEYVKIGTKVREAVKETAKLHSVSEGTVNTARRRVDAFLRCEDRPSAEGVESQETPEWKRRLDMMLEGLRGDTNRKS